MDLSALFRTRLGNYSLLLAAGGALTAAGIYYYRNHTGDEENTTPVAEDQVQDQATDTHTQGLAIEQPQDQANELALAQPLEFHQVTKCPESPSCSTPGMHDSPVILELQNRVKELEELLCEAHKDCEAKTVECEKERLESLNNHRKAINSITHLEKEKSELLEQVSTLRSTVEEMRNLLSDTNLECDELKMECQQHEENNRILQLKYEEMEMELTQRLQNNQEALDSIPRLEKEKSELMEQVSGLRSTIEDMGDLLTQTTMECDELLMVSKEKNHQKALISIPQLEKEKSELLEQVSTLCSTVEEMRNLLSDTNLECDELKMECQQHEENNRILQLKYEEMEMELTQRLQNNQEALDSIPRLEKEKSELMEQVSGLRSTIEDMGDLLTQTNKECDELLMNHQKALISIPQLEKEKSELLEQVSTLRSTVEEMRNLLSDTNFKCDELKMECQQHEENNRILQLKYEEMEMELTQRLQNNQEALDSIPRLEKEKSELMEQVSGLRSTIEDMGALLTQTNMECDELLMECQQHEENNRILQLKYEEMEMELTQRLQNNQEALDSIPRLEKEKSELMEQVSGLRLTIEDMGDLLTQTNMECDELLMNHQKALISIPQLEKEKSELLEQVSTLCSTVEEMRNLLSDTNLECDELKMECQRHEENNRILQLKYEEMEMELTQRLQNNQEALDSIPRLEKEKSELMEQVSGLRLTIEDMGDLLTQTTMECDELLMGCQQHEENNRILQLKYEEMEMELTQRLQNNQEALDSIPRLEKEKSELMEQVSGLRLTIEDMGDLLTQTNKECDELLMEKQAHRFLLSEEKS